MATDSRDPRIEKDGVRVFDDGHGRRTARILVVVAIAAVALVVAVTATAVLFLRRGSGPSTDARDVSARAGGEQRVAEQHVPQQPAEQHVAQQQAAAPAIPAVVRAVRKVQAAHVDAAPTPVRRLRRGDRPQANGVTEKIAAANRPAANDGATDHGTEASAGAADSAAEEKRQRQLESLARDMIAGLRATGETGGLAAFPPPGTVPIKVGLVVPDGYELPPGYMRYYQNTDDGRRLEPILMFSPDYDFVDADGKPVALPKDGVVPPEMAPPGLPQRLLEPPKTRTAGSESGRPGS